LLVAGDQQLERRLVPLGHAPAQGLVGGLHGAQFTSLALSGHPAQPASIGSRPASSSEPRLLIGWTRAAQPSVYGRADGQSRVTSAMPPDTPGAVVQAGGEADFEDTRGHRGRRRPLGLSGLLRHGFGEATGIPAASPFSLDSLRYAPGRGFGWGC
jgi:hypothetical protein